MDYPEILKFLYDQLPMYQRVGAMAFKKDLGNIRILCDHLGNPEKKFKSIHVGGTNGKGSVTHILAATFIHAGYKTGYYTSPHLVDFRERIRVNKNMIPEENVTAFVLDNMDLIKEVKPSFFEITVAMAFDHFAKENVDVAIIEVGLGGRLDSTNIIDPLISIITNIGHDHMDMLGDTLEKVAFEKAGIIKKNTPVIIGQRQPEVEHVFISKAEEMNAKIQFADDEPLGYYIDSDLVGDYDRVNLHTARAAIFELHENLGFDLFTWHEAYKKIRELSGFAGRWHILEHDPYLILDTAHNLEGVQAVSSNLDELDWDHLHMVFGMVQGKDMKPILRQFSQPATYYLVKPQVPRGLDVNVLLEACRELGLKAEAYDSIEEAYNQAKEKAEEDDCIFVGGSTFTAADFLKGYPF